MRSSASGTYSLSGKRRTRVSNSAKAERSQFWLTRAMSRGEHVARAAEPPA